MQKIIIKIKRIKSMPLKQIFKKVFLKLNKEIYYFFRSIVVRNKPIKLKCSLINKFNSNCEFLYKIENKQYYVYKLKSLYLNNLIIKNADKICNHKFNLLGSEEKYLGEKLPWHEDFKSKFTWENKFYKNIKIVDLFNNADVKIPLELSRFQHLFTLGKAYWISNDEKYSIEFKNEIDDWIQNNPVEMSVNWTCTMDVAIRSVNLICGYFFFKKSKSLDNNFWIEFNKLLYLHGGFIYKNLENQGQHNGNHYLSDLAGLIWLGIYFGDFIVDDNERKNNPKIWLDFALKEFENEMKNEINEDGTDYESSTSYHRLVTEIFLVTTILCDKNNINFSKEYMKKLEKMCEFIMDIVKPNGLSPIIGDADDGRFIVMSNYYNWNRRDFRYLLAVAGEYFDRDDFRTIGKDYKEDALWITESFKSADIKIKFNSKAYIDSGYYILRNDRVYCIIRCGELSCKGEGGHSHNDQLSFELNVDGEDFIIDPGTYVYTSDYENRNLFRSTKMHNTLSIDGYEQNDFDKYNLFYMKEQSFSRCKSFSDTEFCGEHYGYEKKYGVKHERKFNLINDKLIIEDKLVGNVIDKKIYINFILDSGAKIKENGRYIEIDKNNKKILLFTNNKYIIENSFVSYAYGQKVDTTKISISIENCENKVEIEFINKEK